MQKFNQWIAQHERDGGLVVFITSDKEFLANVQSTKDRFNFLAEVLYSQPKLSPAPGLRENAKASYEWLTWLQSELSMPKLQMQQYDEADYTAPHNHGKACMVMFFASPCNLVKSNFVLEDAVALTNCFSTTFTDSISKSRGR